MSKKAGDASEPPPSDVLPSVDSTMPPLVDQLGDLSGHSNPHGTDLARVALKQNTEEKNNNSSDDRAEVVSSQELNVVAAYKAHFREDPVAFLQEVWAYGQGSGWRGYNNYIGAPILIPGQSEFAIKEVMNSDAVKARISALAEQRVENLCSILPPPSGVDEREVEKQRIKLERFKQKKRKEITLQLTDIARNISEVSVARLDSLSFLKAFAGVANNVLARMYHQV